MKNWIKLLCVTTMLLSGCGGGGVILKKPPVNAPSDDATIRLAEAATSISNSMLEMARVEKVVTPRHRNNHLTIPSTYNLQTRASIDWSGPVEELTRRIAHAAHYRLHVFGKEPAIPILISLTAKDESLVEILRDIDYQAGRKATIHVYPNHQVIELRYAKIYS
jgi:defect-in-organelle-trafficking protein DotD